MKPLRVLALMHEDLVPPDDPGDADMLAVPWKTEFDVVSTLREMGHEVRALGVRSDLRVVREAIEEWQPHIAFNLLEEFDVVSTLREMGHEVRALGVRSDLRVVREAIEEWQPHIAFNLLEEFDGVAIYDQNVVAYLELLRVPYTGCNPRGLMLSRDKALSKKVLAYHRIPCPDFAVFPLGRAARRPRRLSFPLIVKSLTEDASLGIAQASVVESDEKLRERVAFVHENLGTSAIAERYIEGRELYVGVVGNRRLRVFPVWELRMEGLPDEARPIATQRLKWSKRYQKKYGIRWREARGLPDPVTRRVQELAKRIYRTLGLSGYARIDFRLDAAQVTYALEANPNPEIAYGEELAESAEKAGLSYEGLLQQILGLGLRWRHDVYA
jgi:D-alanine-D-alanine ligase